jgi:hypothetical protein
MGAFFAAPPQKTGLSAPILCTAGAAHKYFRFYPLREAQTPRNDPSGIHAAARNNL